MYKFIFRWPEITKQKTYRDTVSEEIYRKAAGEVLSKENSLRKAANKYEINFMTLCRYIKKQSELPLKKNCKLVGYSKPMQVFTDNLETTLLNYLIHCSRIYYGLTPLNVKILAYDYAKANNVAYPKNWDISKQAFKDWFNSFFKKAPTFIVTLT